MMTKRQLQLVAVACAVVSMCSAVIEYKNWAFHFPANSNMGIFIALAVPIEVPNENVFLAYNIEANYLLPANESETVEFPPLVTEEEQARHETRRIDRNRIYKVVEAKLNAYEYSGHLCLLRMICEVATSSFDHNGVLGDIIHIIFTPSSSTNQGLSASYLQAEEYGRKNKNCRKFHKKCSTSFIDVITWLGRA